MKLIRLSMLAVLLPLAVSAADPATGSIHDGQFTAEWTGGPYLVPNLTNILTEVPGQNTVCEEGTPTCDVYRFEVNVSEIDEDDDQIVIEVSWNNSVTADDTLPDPAPQLPDYDVEVYNDETGDLISQEAGSTAANPEHIVLPAANGKYRLHIIPYAALNEVYAGKVTYVKYDDGSKNGVLDFAGALDGGLLGALGLALLASARRRRPA